jgi:hypothetical protein
MRMFLFRFLGLMKFVVPAVYIGGAVVIWLDFSKTNPDGLANLWLIVYTLPVAVTATFLLRREFPYVAGRYYEAHALYFWPSVAVLACALFLLLYALQKIARPVISPVKMQQAQRH